MNNEKAPKKENKLWKQNLQILMQMHGNYPEKQWYNNLQDWGRTWTNFVRENGFDTKVSTSYPNKVVITAKKHSIDTTSFICELQYKISDSNQPVLSVKSVKSFDFGTYIRATIGDLPTAAESDEERKEQCYEWDEFDIDGADQIFEEGFVMETINLAFARYLKFRSEAY